MYVSASLLPGRLTRHPEKVWISGGWKMFTKSFKIYTNWQVFVSPGDPGGGAAVVGGQKHPAGSKTVLMKIEFYKKMCVLPQRGNRLCHLKGKFGRPNLGVFGEIVFSLQLNTIFFSISIGQIQASFFSLDPSQHLCSLLKQLLVLIDEAPLPHFGI